MKRVLLINSDGSRGSTGMLCREICNYNSADFDVFYAYGYGSCDYLKSYRFSNSLSVKIAYKLSRYFCRMGSFSYLPTFRLIRYIKKLNPQIIHLHNIHDWCINFKMLFNFLNASDIQVVWTLHDCWPFTGGCFHFTTADCYKWKTMCQNCAHKADFCVENIAGDVKKPFLTKQKLLNDAKNLQFTAVSRWLKSTAEQSFLKDKKISCIHNGIDESVFCSNPCDLRTRYQLENRFVILGVASYWGKGKSLDSFLHLADALDDNYRIVIVGNCDKSEILDSKILLYGPTENKAELADLYSTADVLISFSTEETFGLTVAEAMSCKTPVIVFNSTACGEIVENEKTGYVLTVGEDPIPYIKTIRNNGKSAYGENCRTVVEQNYTKKIMCKKYFDLYRTL